MPSPAIRAVDRQAPRRATASSGRSRLRLDSNSVNLFVLGWSPQGDIDLATAHAAVNGVVEALPRLRGQPVETWIANSRPAGLVFASHSQDRTAGVTYRALSGDSMATFAGRPILRSSEHDAAPLWNSVVVRHQLAPTPEKRSNSSFHLAVLN